MTSNNQVSPVIRISRGERDASARATHLEAATRKFLVTTNERKQMSTTTNFKRIALVAVAALGLGVLSSVPSQAAINADTVTLSSATAAQSTAETYTATSAVVTVSFFGVVQDSMSITAALTSAPAGNTALPTLQLVETSSAQVETSTNVARTAVIVGDTFTANTAVAVKARSSSVVTTAKFAVYLTEGNGRLAPSTAGTYGVKITPATIGASGALQGSVAQTLTITVTDAPSLVKTASSVKAFIQAPTSGAVALGITTDSVVAVSKSNSPSSVQAAYIAISQLNAAGVASSDSLTVEITGAGTLGSGAYDAAARGRNLTVKVLDSVTVWTDGNAGVGTITIKSSTSGALLATKTVTFTDVFSKFAKETAAVAILGTSARNAVTFLMQDSVSNTLNSNGSVTLTAFSSDATIATAGTVTYANDSGTVSVTGVKAGTVTITIGNASTLAASTIKSAPVTVRVGSTSIASVKVSFDKTSYSIGEKALITVTPLDSTGLPTVPSALANTFAAGKALKEDKLFSQNALLVDSTTVLFADATSATAGTTAGSATYTVYMPLTSGTVKVTGTLGAATGMAAAIQATEVTASATVTDSGSAALAAVTALATTVASLRTLIVTLTNLVLKIQKKVKA